MPIYGALSGVFTGFRGIGLEGIATISIDLEDGITVIIDTHQGQSRCTIDAEGARDLASALGLAASIVERREKRPELRLVD